MRPKFRACDIHGNKMLDDVVEELENFKDFINSGCAGGC